ncbi:MAG: BMP family ABC transporter substrate-binding protein [Myxococcaceae bacterium]|nr:BMP family ABC transporter substrate-binding protein [Myxococcaceae bacterium]
MRHAFSLVLCAALCAWGCKKSESPRENAPAPARTPKAAQPLLVGLVTDVGGRGDHSFNDSALRGLESWSAGMALKSGDYQPLSATDIAATVPEALKDKVHPLGIKPLVVQSKAQEDYRPNLQLLVDQGADLTVGTGFMLENAVEAVAKANPEAKFLLIDSPLLDAKGTPITLPNVRTVVFREEEGSFLVGALAASVAKKQVGFVGGMEIPLIKKFEAGFRAGVRAVNPQLKVLIAYTGSFDNVAAGKQVAQDLFNKGSEVVFHAAGSDGLGVIQAAKEARAAGRNVYVIGVDSDQYPLAPEAVLSSMVKQVDFAVYQAVELLRQGQFTQGDIALGLKEGGVNYAPIRVELPEKEKIVATLEGLRAKVVAGEIKVPSNVSEH